MGHVCQWLTIDTSRQPRSGETDGKEYHFVTPSEFEKLVSEGKFIEYTKCKWKFGFAVLMLVSSNYYGTTIAAVEQVASTGRKCILDIEMEVLVNLHFILSE